MARNLYESGLPRKQRSRQEGQMRNNILNYLKEQTKDMNYPVIVLNMAVEDVMSKAFRLTTLDAKKRTDGRSFEELRPITANHNVLPVLHGSSFFQRGETHILGSVTLGPRSDAKEMQSLQNNEDVKQPFFLHYDFPPYCKGEVGSSVASNRRIVGHGSLAEKAVKAVMPSTAIEFPYTVRVFAECTSSNGSSSMASVCAASLALMDAGVPLKNAVAGVSIGLISDLERDKWVLLTDILGSEDHYGDMDFKIAGSKHGITGVQLDTKLSQGIPLSILEQAIYKASIARNKILDIMNNNIALPRNDIKESAPRSMCVKYDEDRKRHLFGHGGDMRKYIEDTYNVDIQLSEDDRLVYIFGRSHEHVLEATEIVKELVMEPKENDAYIGEITEVKDFGAIIRLTRTLEGLLHMSEITNNPDLRFKPVSELLQVGYKCPVKIIGVDKGIGAIKLSRKALVSHTPEEPDTVTLQHAVQTKNSVALPTFPLVPPRKWSLDYFK